MEGDDDEKGEQDGFIRWHPWRHLSKTLMFPPSHCLMGDGRKVDLSRLPPMLSPETWAASSQVIGELSQHQGLVVFDIQTSKPVEARLNTDKSRSDEVAIALVQRTGRTLDSQLGKTQSSARLGDGSSDESI
jgi:hypothetical protein